jgi:hypothetical protein
MTPANMVFGRELRLPCDLLLAAPPDKAQSTTDYAAHLAERLHDITMPGSKRPNESSLRQLGQFGRIPGR